MKLVYNDEALKKYPWGTVSYEKTLHGFKQGVSSTSTKRFGFYGFPYAVLIWAFETLPFMVENDIATLRRRYATPRMLKWELPSKLKWDELNKHFDAKQVKSQYLYILLLFLWIKRPTNTWLLKLYYCYYHDNIFISMMKLLFPCYYYYFHVMK